MVQGLGNVGYHAATFCREQGARVVAFAELEGAILDPGGLAEDAVVEYRTRTGSILGSPGAGSMFRSADALELDFDVLIPEAFENQLTGDNAPRIKAKIVIEGARRADDPGSSRDLAEEGHTGYPRSLRQRRGCGRGTRSRPPRLDVPISEYRCQLAGKYE